MQNHISFWYKFSGLKISFTQTHLPTKGKRIINIALLLDNPIPMCFKSIGNKAVDDLNPFCLQSQRDCISIKKNVNQRFDPAGVVYAVLWQLFIHI